MNVFWCASRMASRSSLCWRSNSLDMRQSASVSPFGGGIACFESSRASSCGVFNGHCGVDIKQLDSVESCWSVFRRVSGSNSQSGSCLRFSLGCCGINVDCETDKVLPQKIDVLYLPYSVDVEDIVIASYTLKDNIGAPP